MTENIIQTLFPQVKYTIDQLEKKYPPRNLPANVIVSRIAPSPTGFMHIGNFYSALISERLAHQSDGIFFLRIEDTDKKREVKGAKKLIINSLNNYQITYDEGPTINNSEKGEYGPYIQSQRAEIYQSIVKHLLKNNLAYVCFATPEELKKVNEQQKKTKSVQDIMVNGLYGEKKVT